MEFKLPSMSEKICGFTPHIVLHFTNLNIPTNVLIACTHHPYFDQSKLVGGCGKVDPELKWLIAAELIVCSHCPLYPNLVALVFPIFTPSKH